MRSPISAPSRSRQSEIDQYLPPLSPDQREQAAKDPSVASQLVRSAIGRKLLLDEALKNSWLKKPEIAAEIERGRDEILITAYLQSVALPSPSYPSEDEIRQAYDANRDKFTIPTEYHVAQIFIAEPQGQEGTGGRREKGARDFGARRRRMARISPRSPATSSDDANSAPRGGDLGWLPENQLLPEVATAVEALNGNGITEPDSSCGRMAHHRRHRHRAADPPTLAQMHDRLVVLLRENRENEYVMKMLDDKHLTVNETAAVDMFAAPK